MVRAWRLVLRRSVNDSMVIRLRTDYEKKIGTAIGDDSPTSSTYSRSIVKVGHIRRLSEDGEVVVTS